ncbi:MAG TPA: ABC transporter ATP-binding protein [Candidatus Krumholzibacteria bacterium]|nr:ABC transporter ATP-binding protein [Candidatus Krumholzibacteria bacterium]
MTTAAILSAQGLSRSYRGTGTQVGVLKDVSLEVAEGQVVCIVGASGAGKSTLLHILGSLDRPDTGQVLVRGQDVHAISGKRLDKLRSETLGFVFQFHFLLPDFTALENVMMPALVARRTAADAAKEAAHWLERVGLSDRVKHRPGELSGGEQQRVAIARALINRPAVVFADEPTGNLDDATGEGIHRLIRDLADQDRKTFVVVTHKRQFGTYADRTLELADHTLRELAA